MADVRFFGDYCGGVHLFPFRTESLSPPAQMVLHFFVGEYVVARIYRPPVKSRGFFMLDAVGSSCVERRQVEESCHPKPTFSIFDQNLNSRADFPPGRKPQPLLWRENPL